MVIVEKLKKQTGLTGSTGWIKYPVPCQSIVFSCPVHPVNPVKVSKFEVLLVACNPEHATCNPTVQ